MSWRWTAWRAVISAFVLFHISALMIWTMPTCQIKERFSAPYYYYVLPLGIWQWWAIFAPDPIKDTLVLDAEVIDAKGMRHIHEFPRIGDLPWYGKLPRYRQPKFTTQHERRRIHHAAEVCRPSRGSSIGSGRRFLSVGGQPVLPGETRATARNLGQ